MVLKNQIMDSSSVERTLTRLAHEIDERDSDGSEIVLVGVKRRGVPLANIISSRLKVITGKDIPVGELDISLYRDDLAEKTLFPVVRHSELPFSVEGKTVIIVDDVLYTGRTARAAIEAVFTLGRPAKIRLCVLVDRGHRELPIRADYVGKNVPTSRSERIAVCVPEYDESLAVKLYSID
ncbi:MAG: bifunctional pyr operon transcriptional regulator/uracil phosphoribosyltransferase PyrR [Clostridia bacterium]|nr:bifunctional pyr operon transcriptional regulator/uracil phosphoribosyltransferase PyrR [Clostridia bacterium]